MVRARRRSPAAWRRAVTGGGDLRAAWREGAHGDGDDLGFWGGEKHHAGGCGGVSAVVGVAAVGARAASGAEAAIGEMSGAEAFACQVGSRIKPAAISRSLSTTRSRWFNCKSRTVTRAVGVSGRELPLFDPEVLAPALPAWVVERRESPGLGIEGGQIAPFVLVAKRAREREVLGLGCAAVLLGDDVIDLVRRERQSLRNQAVLARAAGSLVDRSSQRRGDAAHGAWSLSAVFALARRTRCSRYW